MPADPETCLHSLTTLYLRLPETPNRLSRFDLRLARDLCHRQIPFAVIESAFLLASARRAVRPPTTPPLGPIRSLHYFLPVIEELLKKPLPDSYLLYLRRKVSLRHPP